MLTNLKKDLRNFADSEKKVVLQRFFKTGPGQYAEGDIFLGVTVPKSRLVARKHNNLLFEDVCQLLKSPIHEERLVALFILVARFGKGDLATKKKIYVSYLENTKFVNNWDLVDSSADKIIGQYLLENPKEKSVLKNLVISKSLWERRIAIIATYQFIKKNVLQVTLEIAELLLNDKHDLIHKAVGWMLREIGKRDKEVERSFLRIHKSQMPRTMLRYAIEHFSPEERAKFLRKDDDRNP